MLIYCCSLKRQPSPRITHAWSNTGKREEGNFRWGWEGRNYWNLATAELWTNLCKVNIWDQLHFVSRKLWSSILGDTRLRRSEVKCGVCSLKFMGWIFPPLSWIKLKRRDSRVTRSALGRRSSTLISEMGFSWLPDLPLGICKAEKHSGDAGMAAQGSELCFALATEHRNPWKKN